MIKNRGTILCAHVRALAVQRSWVVKRKKDLQDFPIGDDTRIEGNLHNFGVPRVAVAHLFVRRVWRRSATIAGLDVIDSLELLEDCFAAPEAAAAHRG